MKNGLIAAAVAVAITYTLDVYFFNGYYYKGFTGFVSGVTRSFR